MSPMLNGCDADQRVRRAGAPRLPHRGFAISACLLACVSLTYARQLQAPAAGDRVELAVDASKSGAKIDRNIFGQFAEHLGRGVYEGVWVGPDSTIPNTRGIRNDVVAALKALKVPHVRWPGGCFADEYHWRKGIGPAGARPATLNPNWGGVIEPNAFGTHEFMDFLGQIGSEAFISVNVGSGTPQEAAEWLEYLTTAQQTTLAKERASNGHPAPYKLAYLGIGNENWDCGGNMTPEYYLSQLKIYSRFVRNFNPEQQDASRRMLRIAVGPGGNGRRWTEWTDTIMKAWQGRQWSWDMEGLSLHNYTVVRWPAAYASVGFGEKEYAEILQSTLRWTRSSRRTRRSWTSTIRRRRSPWSLMNGARGTGNCRDAHRLPRAAEQPARCDARVAEPEYLRASRRSRAHGQHRADGQRAAGDDPD